MFTDIFSKWIVLNSSLPRLFSETERKLACVLTSFIFPVIYGSLQVAGQNEGRTPNQKLGSLALQILSTVMMQDPDFPKVQEIRVNIKAKGRD